MSARDAGESSGKISLAEKIGYGCGDLASNLVFQVIINFLQAYYTDTALLDPARIALIFGVVRLTDAVTDPIMGGLADRTQTRWGQYRPWLLWLAIPFGAAYVLAFSIGGYEEPLKSWFAFGTYFLLLVVYTAINIPYGAMATVLTPDPDERMSIRSWQFAMAQTSNIVVGAATLPLVALLGGGDDLKGFQLTVCVYAAIAVALFFVCFLSTRERIMANGLPRGEGGAAMPQKPRNVSILDDLKALFRNDQWVLLAVIQFFLLIAIVMRGANTFYFAQYILNSEQLFSAYLTLAGVSAVVASLIAGRFMGGFGWRDVILSVSAGALFLAIIYALRGTGIVVVLPLKETIAAALATLAGGLLAHFLGRRLNRVQAFSAVYFVMALSLFAISLTGPDTRLVGLFVFILSAFLGQLGVPILWSMLSDCVDYGQKITGIRNNGLIFSSALFALKLGVTVGGVFGGLILSWTGYQPGVEQTELALNGILLAFSIIPGAACLLVALIGLRLKLTEGYVRDVQAELKLSEGKAV